MKVLFFSTVITLLFYRSVTSYSVETQCVQCIPKLTGTHLSQLQSLSKPSRLKTKGEFLKPILKPRVSGTANNTLVRTFIKTTLEKLDWHVELDTFKSHTPFGEKEFSNIVATKNPLAKKSLVMAAHYDSKYFAPPDEFIGALDSAVSCALLLDLASSLNNLLDKNKSNDVTLKLIFFDGEEAFVNWDLEDSLYGARHLATKLHTKLLSHRINQANLNETELSTIQLFVLLDLLGSNTPLVSLNSDTNYFFNKLIQLESKIFQYKLNPNSLKTKQFRNIQYRAHIDDDHRPFMEKGVPVLHLIPVPFPEVWHKVTDNENAIDGKVVNHLALLFRAFVSEYLCLYQ